MTNARDKANIPVLNFQSKGIDDNADATAITIDSSERIGIGNATPSNYYSNKLVIDCGSASQDGLTIVSESTKDGMVSFADGTSGSNRYSGFILYDHADNEFRIATNGSEKLRITSAGLVGIGTSNPLKKLVASNSGAEGIELSPGDGSNRNMVLNYNRSTSAYIASQQRASYHRFDIDTTEGMRLTSTGLGIGTSAPSAKLDVATGSSGAIFRYDTASTFLSILPEDANGDVSLRFRANSGSAPDLLFKSDNGSEVVRIGNNGNVGIGTSSPENKLDVRGIVNCTNASSEGSGTEVIRFARSDYPDFYHSIFASSGTGSSSDHKLDFRLNTGSSNTVTSRMTLVGNGNVGIGTSSPNGILELKSTGNTNFFITAGNTSASQVVLGDTDDIDVGKIAYSHNVNSMEFIVNASERMRITSTGQVAINTTSPDVGSITSIDHPGSSKYALRANSTETSGTQYHLLFSRGGTAAGYLVSGSATTVNLANASDKRLKENIENSGSAIQDIKDIQVRQFDWIDNIDTHRDFGFVAQELVNVVPEAVTQGTDELDDNGKPVRSWGVDYSHIVPRLVKVCQEQQTQIQELEARITTLEANNP